MVTVTRENGRTLLTFEKSDRVHYKVFLKLLDNRFYCPNFDEWWIYRGPDTDWAAAAAKEIADTYNACHAPA